MCEAEGFSLAGVSPLRPSGWGEALRQWLLAGKHGEMAWLAETVADRLDPTRALPGARAVVMVADFYSGRHAAAEPTTLGNGRVARYAQGRDYHDVVKRRLRRVCDRVRSAFAGATTRAFCDTGPVLEREFALWCGLGWIGKHTLLIHPERGSWMVLGGFLTSLELEPPSAQRVEPDRCGSCTRCIDACPTDAIQPYGVDARRCISYLTIEHQGPIAAGLAARVGNWLVGCDVCQEVCPHNSPRAAPASPVRADYAPRRSGFDPLDVIGWDEATRRGRFATSAMKRVTLAQMKRNAVLVLASILAADSEASGGPEAMRNIRSRLTDLAWDAREPEEVRGAARSALGMRLSADASDSEPREQDDQ
ncbi:MAG: tRNA epoxyqueuosine(34) reductase QueG [Phycisphaerales bacterium]|nr:tRNA epoxyqueuosine(34) reductase QueG [Phycisphaerales bacterium]